MPRVMLLLLIGALVSAQAADAQACTPPKHPYFEYQVERAVSFIGDTTARPRPRLVTRRLAEQNADPATLIVAFIVDSLGTAQAGSLHVLKSPSQDANGAVYAAYTAWKFTPALVGGCRVAQLVQTEVER